MKKGLIILIPMLIVFSFIGIKFYNAQENETINNKVEDYKPNNNIVYNENKENKEDLENIFIAKEEHIENILVMGVDEGGERSDVMIVASVNKEDKSVKLTSVMRDTLSYIPTSNTYQKLNHSYMEGGPEETLLAFNENFGLDIKDYVVFDYDSVIDIIDFMGGYPTYVTSNEAKDMEISEGDYTLDGKDTLTYMRIRYNSGGDQGRNQRQRDVMFYIMEEAKDLDTFELIKFAGKLLPSIKTSYTLMDVKDLMGLYDVIKNDMAMEEYSFPSEYKGKILNDNLWYAVPKTLESNVKTMHENIHGSNYELNDKIIEINEEIIRRSGVE